MPEKIVIVSASSFQFFHFLTGMILSVKDKERGTSVDICVYDLGMSDEQRKWLDVRNVQVTAPTWEFGITELDGFSNPFKGILARPMMRKYFPGYDVYMQLDADAWIQGWEGVDTYVAGARKGVIAVAPEIERAYAGHFRLSPEYRALVEEIMQGCGGEEYAEKFRYYPCINTGVFAMHRDSPLWDLWAQELKKSMETSRHHAVEQASLNVAIFDRLEEWIREGLQFLPAVYNWLCHQALPMYDKERELIVEPFLPHAPVRVIHRSTDDFKNSNAADVRTVQGDTVRMNLKYREGQHPEAQDHLEVKLEDWQAPTWVHSA